MWQSFEPTLAKIYDIKEILIVEVAKSLKQSSHLVTLIHLYF